MIPEELDKILATTDKVKFIYVIPNYQNPTGICWSPGTPPEIYGSRYQV